MPSDLPPQQVIINNDRQSGGSNIGIQNNLGPKERKLAPALQATLSKLLGTDLGQNLIINGLMNDPEAGKFASTISGCRIPSQRGIMGMCGSYGANSSGNIPNGIVILVKDWKNPPPLAKQLLDAFNSNHIFAWPTNNDTMLPDQIRIDVLAAPVDELK